LRWLELKNKFEIYFLVENAATRLGISPVERTPLPEQVEWAYALGPFLALWGVEGLGHVYGEQALKDDPAPRGLLTSPEADAVRPGARLMLHAGLGLAFAQKVLESLSSSSSAGSPRAAIERFVRLCRDNARTGYIGAAYESLGLVTRSFYPGRVADVDAALREAARDLVGYFWHGVGRAIYFAPRNFLPSHDIDWARAPQTAPDELGRLNLTAGLAWAVTLTNMRQPAVMERLLKRQGEVLSRTPAFANGVSSSIVMRSDTTPDANFIGPFCSYRPEPVTEGSTRLWDRLIAGPCRDAVSRELPRLARASRLDSVFEYRPANDRHRPA
jgi:hypothetical protein